MMAGILAVAAVLVLAFDIASVVEWPWVVVGLFTFAVLAAAAFSEYARRGGELP